MFNCHIGNNFRKKDALYDDGICFLFRHDLKGRIDLIRHLDRHYRCDFNTTGPARQLDLLEDRFSKGI